MNKKRKEDAVKSKVRGHAAEPEDGGEDLSLVDVEHAAEQPKRKGHRPSRDKEGPVPSRRLKASAPKAEAKPAKVAPAPAVRRIEGSKELGYRGKCKLNPHGSTSYSGRAGR
jgi:hypothetical protein